MRLLVVLFCLLWVRPASATLFTDAERAAMVAYWHAPGRYRIELTPDYQKNGLWQVRLTPDASLWFLKYQIAIGAAKAPPTQDPTAAAPPTAAWKTWVDAKLAYDRWQAQAQADATNLALKIGAPRKDTANPPAPPGLIPPDLLAAVGDPPLLAAAVPIRQATVTFEDNEVYPYPDNVRLSPRYAYYRFPQGTVAYGTFLRDMTDAELDPLFAAAGFSPSEQRVAKAVSRLEGGFETVNTYDTGYVSIGFVQFITADTGKGSLLEVLAREKADNPIEYTRDFQKYGLDVTTDGVLVAVDPETGAELIGAPAVQKIIEDKRLTAVFQRAGRHSLEFRVAQIRVAKSHYWPADDTFTVTVGGQALTGKVSDVVHSEARLATLFDRKVNRGSIAPFADVLAQVMTTHSLTTLAQAADYEREIVAGQKYRTDFLADKTLSQPKEPPKPPAENARTTR